MNHRFSGKWISMSPMAEQLPRNRFYQHTYKMLRKMAAKDPVHNWHVLFRKTVDLDSFRRGIIYITADDYYKLYVNGELAAMGPAMSYVWAYRYNRIDVTKYLHPGKNTIAVHTYYQGLVNRYLVSGDLNHGLLMDLEVDGKVMAASDESFRCAVHSGYLISGKYGYQTCFREDYDANAPETRFEKPDYDDSAWTFASLRTHADYTLVPQETRPVVWYSVFPKKITRKGSTVQIDLGRMYAGYLQLTARGHKGDTVIIKSAQELKEDGSAMYELRTSRVEYLEQWTLSGGEDRLEPYDYKPMRYADIELPEGAELLDVSFTVRHYPFRLKAKLNPALLAACKNETERRRLQRVWKLCVNTLRYGPQDTIFDCLDRERGTYLADVGMAAATHSFLTGDPTLLRGMIHDAFAQTRICDSLGAGTCCTFIHLTAEYPLVFFRTLYFTYCLTGDKKALREDYKQMTQALDCYRRDYEKDGLLGTIDKWCVVEWPKEYRDGYDANLDQHDIEEDTHIVLNMHYYKAICTANLMAEALGLPVYRPAEEVGDAIIRAFYDWDKHLFRDRIGSEHTSYIGNLYPMAFGLIPEEAFRTGMEQTIRERSVSAVNEFGPFPILEYFCKQGDWKTVKDMLLDPGAWLLMMKEGADTTYEAWGKSLKWNTSLFHNSLAYAALFCGNFDYKQLLR